MILECATLHFMARKEILSFVDDLDSTELDVDDTHSVDWSWLGVEYRLDVSSENLDKIENGKVPLARLLPTTAGVESGRDRRAPGGSRGVGQRCGASVRSSPTA
jgi:hypothetical protein